MSAVLASNTFWGSPCSPLGCPHRILLPPLPMMLELCSQGEGHQGGRAQQPPALGDSLWFLTCWEGRGHAEYFCFWFFFGH